MISTHETKIEVMTSLEISQVIRMVQWASLLSNTRYKAFTHHLSYVRYNIHPT